MTVQKLFIKNLYEGDGANKSFPITFEWDYKHPERIKVYVRKAGEELRQAMDFSLTQVPGTDTWNVNYPVAGDALGAGDKIVIARELPLYQLLNLVNQGPYFAEDIELTFDEVVKMIQQLNEKLDRSTKLEIDIDSNFNATLPIVPGKSFKVNDEGTGFETTDDPAEVRAFAEAAVKSAEEAAENADYSSKKAATEAIHATNSADRAAREATGTYEKIIEKINKDGYSLIFATVADMKEAIANIYSVITEGSIAKTAGYYNPNDGGGAYYVIKSAAETDLKYVEDLGYGLVAELVIEPVMTPIQFGAKGDGVTDDYVAIQNAVNYAFTLDGLDKTYSVMPLTPIVEGQRGLAIRLGKGIKFVNGTYKMADDAATRIMIDDHTYENYISIFAVNTTEDILFENVCLDGNKEHQTIINWSEKNQQWQEADGWMNGLFCPYKSNSGYTTMKNCTIKNCGTDDILYRKGFLTVDNCKVIGARRNGVCCDTSCHIVNSYLDTTDATRNPLAGFRYEPNTNEPHQEVSIYIECCETNRITLDLHQDTTVIRNYTIINCSGITTDGLSNIGVHVSTGQIDNVLISNNKNFSINIEQVKDAGGAIENVVIDNNIGTLRFGDAAANGEIKNLTIKSMTPNVGNQLLFRSHCTDTLTLENCTFDMGNPQSTSNNYTPLYQPSSFHPRVLVVKNCTFKNGAYGLNTYTDKAENYGERAYFDNCYFENMYRCFKMYFKEIYVHNIRTKDCSDYAFACSAPAIVIGSDSVFCQTEAKAFNNVGTKGYISNCAYSYPPPAAPVAASLLDSEPVV